MTEFTLFDSARLRVLDGTIDLNTHVFKAALLGSSFVPYAAANWVPAQAYIDGDIVKSSGGIYYEALLDGISSGSEPTFDTTRGNLSTDNTVTWRCWGHTPPSTYSLLADVAAHELSGGGYTAGGIVLPSPSLTLTRRRVVWSAGDLYFGELTGEPKYAVIYRAGSENGVVNPLLGYILFDSSDAALSLTTDNPFTLTWGSSGIFVQS